MTDPPHQVETPIRPRTKEERMAYLAGYAAAILDADKHGVQFAAGWLSAAYEVEERM